MFLGLFKSKKEKFIEDAVVYFYKFGITAGLKEEMISRLMPNSPQALNQIDQLYAAKMKPVDAAMVMADLCLRNTQGMLKLIEDNKLPQLADADEMSRNLMATMAQGDVNAASKLQESAFEVGIKSGSSIVLQEGKFKGLFEKFSEPVK